MIREGAPKSASLEEYLHGTQLKLGQTEKYGSREALEVHVKDFMLKHAKILGLDNSHDIKLLQQLKLKNLTGLIKLGGFMINKVRIELTDYHIFSSSQTCLIGIANPKEHKLITSNCVARIVVDNELEFPLNIVGQDINARNTNTIKNDQTFLRTNDNLDEVIKYFGKKKIIVIVEYSD